MSKAKKNKTKKSKKTWFKRLRATKAFKWTLGLLVVICLMPFLLTILYKLESTRPLSTLMMGGYLSSQEVKRDWVSIDDVAPWMVHSIIMSEDGQFCAHDGIDWDALNNVIDDALEGEKTRGASTLTMQTAKNLFLWNSRSYIRKGLEVPLALYIDAVLSKRRIMEIYLNIAEWDAGVYGIEAASQHYFGRSSKKLTRRQAALLTVTLPNPKARNPKKPTRSQLRVAKIIENRAKKAGAYVKCVAAPKS